MEPIAPLEALAMLEIDGLPTALRAKDVALKQAEIQVVAFTPVSDGKVLFIFGGPVAEVEESLKIADVTAGSRRIDKLWLPGIHPDVFRALYGPKPSEAYKGTLGMMELETVCAGIHAADIAIKTAAVTLDKLHPATGFGGKTFLTFFGDQPDVEAALESAAEQVGSRVLDHELIPAPHHELAPHAFIRPWPLDPAQ